MIRVTGMFFFSFWPILSIFWPVQFLLIETYYKSQIPNFDRTLPFTISSIIYFLTSLAAYVLLVSIALPAPSRQPLRSSAMTRIPAISKRLPLLGSGSDLLWDVTWPRLFKRWLALSTG